MGKFILGVLFTLVMLAAGAYIVTQFGFLNVRADEKPSAFEKKYAMGAMDSYIERHAPSVKNPIAPTEDNLKEGMTLYSASCAQCHGLPKEPETKLGPSFYPPAPQFLSDAADMPESENFYIIKHGVRLTGMPAWGGTLSDQDIWKITTFLSHMDKLPPAVDQQWKQ
jgi:thiosulfate dehydrogenase